MKKLVVALGGNAISSTGTEDYSQQDATVKRVASHLVTLCKRYEVAFTHGNGPQVGNQLLRSEAAGKTVPAMPVDVAVASTQGELGYLIQKALQNELGKKAPVATVVTQVLVDKRDSAFQNPSKPVGPYYSEAEARRHKERGWTMMPDPKGRGFRRTVPSPQPQHIVEAETIKRMMERDILVIACGGGGIPVVDERGKLVGVEGVIDKDMASALLAEEIGADELLILTDVKKVALNFGKLNQQWLDRMTVEEAEGYAAEGHFAAGSMGPKVKAAVFFLEHGGKRAVIGSAEEIGEVIEGRAGTEIVP